MAARLSFSRKDAVALPLTVPTVEEVIARTRLANLAQMLLSVLLVAGLLLGGRVLSGTVSFLFYGGAALAAWGMLATALSTWDHARTAAALRRNAASAIAREGDPARFWWAHRGLFPYFSR